MKQNNTAQLRRRRRLAPAGIPARVQQEADFTAEGSPPPGRVGAGRPALPEDGQDTPPATAGEERGKR